MNGQLRHYFKSEAFEFFLLTSEGPAREFRGEQEVHYRSTRTLDRPRDTARLRIRLGGDTPGIAVSLDRRVENLLLD